MDNTHQNSSVLRRVHPVSQRELHRLKMLANSIRLNKRGYQWKIFCKELKENIRDRDGRQCMICRKPEGRIKLCVHHISHNKEDSTESNLISLCRGCHATIHSYNIE